ncbi:MAG: carbon-nitrogen hydrolase family protein [Victivallaceae bacterium]|nr:carbon-nitrogen hydrolase family protein [Victivallaceae bacterium]
MSTRQEVNDKIDRPILRIAASQFPVTGNVEANAGFICRHMREAARQKCDVISFPESALTGYFWDEKDSYRKKYNYAGSGGSEPQYSDWKLLHAKFDLIARTADRLDIWTVFGSAHYVSSRDKPLNCLYIIDNKGKLVDRHDKVRICPFEEPYYSAGNHITVVDIKGIRCGFLICADYGGKNFYNAYRQQGVTVLFHSYYNAWFSGPIEHDNIIPGLNRECAREYGFWIVATNSSQRHSCWPTAIFSPDGIFCKSMDRHIPGIICHDLPIRQLQDSKNHPYIVGTGSSPSHQRVLDRRLCLNRSIIK